MSIVLRRDTIMLILAMAGLAGAFFYAVFLPGQHRVNELKAEIDEAKQQVSMQPARMHLMQVLSEEMEAERETISVNRKAVPVTADLPEVISQVSEAAEDAGLEVTRLSPLQPEEHATYTRYSYELRFVGSFASMTRFLREMEHESRLFTFESINLSPESKRESQQGGKTNLEGWVKFSVYAENADSSDSKELALNSFANQGR
ncbi:type IV pilus inner membrane component PilO [Calycomorphotria hydatis]|uniref:Pilus assembly protein, PilO n=1 Tax=Calycomorphotria hydatis TaxID=2528027 RepID=A0A517TF18_9PLAN|nr:type 4a pilus biogenesis protein PilO [Calycomorphotria hydatis]QDT66971.1 Pilus assembly protein, PilO [Calycomorphotria hydatis]